MILHPERLDDLLPKKKEYRRAFKVDAGDFCGYIHGMGVILVNGDVGLCCAELLGDYTYGNVFKKKLKQILKSKEYALRKKKIFKREYPLCQACTIAKGSIKTICFEK